MYIVRREAEFRDLAVELSVRDQIGRFGIACEILPLQLVLGRLMFAHVERLTREYPVRALDDGT